MTRLLASITTMGTTQYLFVLGSIILVAMLVTLRRDGDNGPRFRF